MENDITGQLVQAAASLSLGLAAGLFYDLLRAVRERVRAPAFTLLADILFVLVCAALLFLCGLTAGEGRQRLFMTMLAVLGGALYFRTVSRAALVIFRLLANAGAFLLRCAAFPVLFCLTFLKKVNNFFKKYFQNAKKRYKIKHPERVAAPRKVQRGREKEVAGREAETNGIIHEDTADRAHSVCNHRTYRPSFRH